ncbi:MAG: hypothetical protein Q7S58_21095 [Candidatus Binatus sp.]|uniref:hypothetical protein n=1 Tax=Candidatus Binatus sp. TaxID=2811406 RepID=UPI0027157455|nr:hypothetical protein [Candidatus Binatus sp.]MDO8434904.1 hypothetical protein [Candidatus Binatus sp.]
MNGTEVESRIRALAAEKRLPATHLERWLALDHASRARLLEIMEMLKLRTGQIVTAIDLLDEIRVRDRIAIAQLLDRPAIVRVLKSAGSTPSRASALLDELRAMRFPQMRAMQSRLEAEIAALKLPRGIAVVLPRDLGNDELTVSIRAHSGAEFERMLAALELRKAGLIRVIGLLGGKE